MGFVCCFFTAKTTAQRGAATNLVYGIFTVSPEQAGKLYYLKKIIPKPQDTGFKAGLEEEESYILQL